MFETHAHGLLVVLSLSLAVTACKKDPPPEGPPTLSQAQWEDLQKATEAALTRARDMDKERHAIVMKSPPDFAPHPELGRCSVTSETLLPQDPTKSDTNNGARALRAQRITHALTMTDLVRPGKTGRQEGPAEARLKDIIRDKQPKKDAPVYRPETPEKRVDAWKATLAAEEHGYDLSFIATTFKEPVMASKDTFTPGEAEGVLSLWSRDKHAIVCAALVGGIGSGGVTLRGRTEGEALENADLNLFGDLFMSVIDQGLPQLLVAGPPVSASAPRDAGAPKKR